MRKRSTWRFVPLVVLLCSVVPGRSWVFSAEESIPDPKSVVNATASATPARVKAGRRVRVEITAEIRSGYHINSNRPAGDYLIPTELRLKSPAGFSLEKIDYPTAHLESFPFASKKIPVYDGKVSFVAWLRANEAAGPQRLEFELSYQACNDRLCLPPARISVTAPIEVIAAK